MFIQLLNIQTEHNLIIGEIFVAGLGKFLARAFLHISKVFDVLVTHPDKRQGMSMSATFLPQNQPAVKPGTFHLVTRVGYKEADGIGSDLLPVWIDVD